MFNKYFKLILAVSTFGFAIQQFLDGSIGTTGNGIMLVLLSLTFILLYFKNEFLILAFFQLRKQNLGLHHWVDPCSIYAPTARAFQVPKVGYR